MSGNTPAYAGKTCAGSLPRRASRKHPRLRGEDPSEVPTIFGAIETPPLTRGRLFGHETGNEVVGNTPAYAGKTPSTVVKPAFSSETPPLTRGRPQSERQRQGVGQKHPRLRGEDFAPRATVTRMTETPPLTRGRRPAQALQERALGNTPAYAGKTRSQGASVPMPQKHPRLRGEDAPREESRGSTSETPPLTRGRPQATSKETVPKGNTPAYAGKTYDLPVGAGDSEKHPRLRGEDSPRKSVEVPVMETPPLTRGRRFAS